MTHPEREGMPEAEIIVNEKGQRLYRLTCDKCGRVTTANSENTLIVDMAQHRTWHELHPDE
ncbi:MAG: hypothetical protein ACLP5V_10745 [Candidatus Bathyarchaeia archaeon]